MNERMKKLWASMQAKTKEAEGFVDDGNTESAEGALAELEELKRQYNVLQNLQEDENTPSNAVLVPEPGSDPGKADAQAVTDAFVGAVTAMATGETDVRGAVAMMTTADPDAEGISDGGLTVPKDIVYQIRELRDTPDDLTQYVNIETVKTQSGARVIEVNADAAPWDNVGEAAQFLDAQTPNIKSVEYKIHKKGGILKLTYELLADTAANIMAFLQRWIAKKSRITRNWTILSVLLSALTENGNLPKAVASFTDLKTMVNVDLQPEYAATATAFTNQTGFNWLDTLVDNDGHYIMQPNVTEPTKPLLFGGIPVVVLNNATLKNDTTDGLKAPIYLGDLKEAVTLFDRENMTIDINDKGDNDFTKDTVSVRVRERFDVQVVVPSAVLYGLITIEEAAAPDLPPGG